MRRDFNSFKETNERNATRAHMKTYIASMEEDDLYWFMVRLGNGFEYKLYDIVKMIDCGDLYVKSLDEIERRPLLQQFVEGWINGES